MGSIAHYQDWHKGRLSIKKTGQEFYSRFDTPEDQDIIITIDYLNKRKSPYGCPHKNFHFNIYIIEGGSVVKGPLNVSGQTGHGLVEFSAKKGKNYKFLVINWGDTTA